jgi:hypothetical protein
MLLACGRSPASFDSLLMGAFALDLCGLALSQSGHPLLPFVTCFRRYANDANARCDDLVLARTETSSLEPCVSRRGDVFGVAELPDCERAIDLRRSIGGDRHGRYDSSVASRRNTERGSQSHFWIVSDENRDLLSPYPHNPVEAPAPATIGVCYGNMEGLNDLRSASGKDWIGIGRLPGHWRAPDRNAGLTSE